jgi:hypothetical protein
MRRHRQVHRLMLKTCTFPKPRRSVWGVSTHVDGLVEGEEASILQP